MRDTQTDVGRFLPADVFACIRICVISLSFWFLQTALWAHQGIEHALRVEKPQSPIQIELQVQTLATNELHIDVTVSSTIALGDIAVELSFSEFPIQTSNATQWIVTLDDTSMSQSYQLTAWFDVLPESIQAIAQTSAPGDGAFGAAALWLAPTFELQQRLGEHDLESATGDGVYHVIELEAP